jgi:hypothetical protein
VRSFNLTYLETISITPRIKVGSILLGFFILQQSLSILEFSVSNVLSFPIELEIALFFMDRIGGGGISTQISNFVVDLLLPLNSVLPEVGLLLMVLGGGLFLFGFPRRSELELTTTGGNRFRINAGIPSDLTVLERLHHTQHDSDLDIQEFPLETSFQLKEAFKITADPNEREILLLLDRKPTQTEELCRLIPSLSHEEIDATLSSLQSKRLVEYLVDEDKWTILGEN